MSDVAAVLNTALAGRYALGRELGRGGMATVFLAEDVRHRRRVAIKVLSPEIAGAIGPSRFLREVEVAASLNHPHVLPLLDSGEANGVLYYVMPYVEGESLRERLTREKQLPLDDALRIAREVADALSYAHSRDVVHRDIKPENILIQSRHAVVADFGIARAISAAGGSGLTATGMAVGTPAYMSPEQAAGSKHVDGRSDVYSLGCVLYEMLAGQPPFTGPTAESLVYQHLSVEAPTITLIRPAVPGWVVAALQRALAKTPADRFSPVALFADALAHLGPAAVSTAAPGGPAHARSAIAVLPFENLTTEGPNAYFAGGLHGELLTLLVKVAAFRVISRTSVMGYQGTSKPLRAIATELGVGSVVEGSVQVAGGRLRVNVQLIDAATDEHVWAERYDRTLDDAFAIQSEVAQRIVAALGTALTGAEQETLATAPTANAEAYRLYLQGREYWTRPGVSRTDVERAQQFYERALELDPDFALAHAALSQVHGMMYWQRYDPTPARAERMRQEAEAASRLAADLPQAHLAIGMVHYRTRHDYRRALDHFMIALQGLPNDAEVWGLVGYARRRLGDWNGAFSALDRAAQLNPREAQLFHDLAGETNRLLHRHADAEVAFDRALNLAPNLHVAEIKKAWNYVVWRGQLDPLRSLLARLPSDADLGDMGSVNANRAALLLLQRDHDGLLRLAQAASPDVFQAQEFFYPSSLYAAWAHQLRRDSTAAHAEFEAACTFLDSALIELPDDWRVHAARGLALAGLGRRDEARDEAHWIRQAVLYREDAFLGRCLAEERARILALIGDAEGALEEIERLVPGPSYAVTVPTLRLDPLWDPIREHPGFKSLLDKHGSATFR